MHTSMPQLKLCAWAGMLVVHLASGTWPQSVDIWRGDWNTLTDKIPYDGSKYYCKGSGNAGICKE